MAQLKVYDQSKIRGKATFLINLGSGASETIDVSALADADGATARVNLIDVEWSSAAGITVKWDATSAETALQLSGNGKLLEMALPYSTASGATGDIIVTAGSGVATAILTVRKVAGFAARTDYSG
ncbi:hypothetical protein CL614_10705 [archaeon]|nr:hypothetical protein [archaeon]MAH44165.1 hypothetical protein [archaeon]|tara:strand:+ start:2507 stop:2884 length:378 start_codon:yes stop_codon:yes gene_type:complete